MPISLWHPRPSSPKSVEQTIPQRCPAFGSREHDEVARPPGGTSSPQFAFRHMSETALPRRPPPDQTQGIEGHVARICTPAPRRRRPAGPSFSLGGSVVERAGAPACDCQLRRRCLIDMARGMRRGEGVEPVAWVFLQVWAWLLHVHEQDVARAAKESRGGRVDDPSFYGPLDDAVLKRCSRRPDSPRGLPRAAGPSIFGFRM